MLNIGRVRQVAGYEMKMLLRNQVFFLMACVIIIGVPVCQYWVLMRGYIWSLIALPCALPVVNAFIFNILQSLLVIFLVGDFVASERKADTLEALRVRAYGNTDYVMGKAFAIIGTVSIVNVAAFLPLMVWHGFTDGLPFGGWLYFFYWITLTFPVLVFMTGLALWLFSVVRFSFVALGILIGFFLLDVFWLSEKMYGVLDYMAVAIPNIFSEEMGHVGLNNYLLQRLWIFLLGMGCLVWVIVNIRRADDTPKVTVHRKVLGGLVLLSGIGTGVLYYGSFWQEKCLRQECRKLCIQYEGRPAVDILRHSMVWEQAQGRMKVTDTLTVVNPGENSFTEMFFYLNPGLKIETVESGGVAVGFCQRGVVLELDETLGSGERKQLIMKYSGYIDEYVCHLNVPDSLYDATAWSNSLLRYGKHTAHVSGNYTFLTPECLWYPVSCAPYRDHRALLNERDFSSFRLEVRHKEGVMSISQGMAVTENDRTIFTNGVPLAGLTLCIGNYEKERIWVDSLCCEAYFFNRNGVFFREFDGSQEGISEGIRRVMKSLEDTYGCRYPFEKLALIETPVFFCSYPAVNGYGSNFVQPELLFVPESWCKNSHLNPVESYVKDAREWNSTEPDSVLEARCFENFYKTNFRDVVDEFPPMSFRGYLLGWQSVLKEVKNPLSLTPMFTDYMGGLCSDEFPGIDAVVNGKETGEQEKLSREAGRVGAPSELKVLQYLTTHSLEEAFSDPAAKDILADILKLKSRYLQQYLYALTGKNEYKAFRTDWQQKHRFQMTDFREYAAEVRRYFGIEMEEIVRKLYEQKNIPAFRIGNLCQQCAGDTVFFAFDVWNTSVADGVITCYANDDNFSGMQEVKSLFIRAGECCRVVVLLPGKSDRVLISTNLSENLPGSYSVYYGGDPESCRIVPQERQVLDTAFFGRKQGEIIVDNEDAGFRVKESKARKIFRNDLSDVGEYASSADFIKGEFQGWIKSVYTDAYGKQIRSFYAKKVGNGTGTAQWTADIPEAGEYEMFVYHLGLQNRFQQTDSVKYHYTLEQGKLKAGIKMEIGKNSRELFIHTQDNSGYEDEFVFCMKNYDADWVPVGKYVLSAGKVCLVLYDRGISGRLIFADAVKWVKL